MPAAHGLGATHESPPDSDQPAGGLQIIRREVEAADCLRLPPRDLLDLAIRLHDATLAAIDDAARSGSPNPILERLYAVWRDTPRRHFK